MLKKKITETFGMKHPMVNAAMSLFRTIELCVAMAEAGGLGVNSHTNVSP
ncbi:hypothetical protein LCGC14_2262420 [marine sediment metagenome]|uniref:Uncharacterized protein n=1 Tax=marine sediment metagenome TaxID=412755 RepID=A0A0F9DLM9_9ZZZZ